MRVEIEEAGGSSKGKYMDYGCLYRIGDCITFPTRVSWICAEFTLSLSALGESMEVWGRCNSKQTERNVTESGKHTKYMVYTINAL